MKYKEFVVKLKEPIDMDSLDVEDVEAIFAKE